MKKTLIIASTLVLAVAGNVSAQIIDSVQFSIITSSNPAPSSYFSIGSSAFPGAAGISGYNVANWNQVLNSPTGNGTSKEVVTTFGGSFVDSTGAPSALTGSVYSDGFSYGTNQKTGSFSPGNQALLNGSGTAQNNANPSGPIPSPTITLTLNGLNPGDTYDLVAYTDIQNYSGGGPGNGGYTETATDGNTSSAAYFLGANTTLTNFVQASSTLAGANVANYGLFTGLTGSSTISLNLVDTSDSGYGVGLNGFQLIDVGASAVPEPSTWSLLAFGVLALIMAGGRSATRVSRSPAVKQ